MGLHSTQGTFLNLTWAGAIAVYTQFIALSIVVNRSGSLLPSRVMLLSTFSLDVSLVTYIIPHALL